MKSPDEIAKELLRVQLIDKNTLDPCYKLEVNWDYCQPYFYGEYKGILKNGEPCIIDFNWKIKVYKTDGNKVLITFDGDKVIFKTDEQVGTDQIKSWFCTVKNLKSVIDVLEQAMSEE